MIAAEDRLLVVIPPYNERSNLPELSEQIFAVLPDCELLIVDDASPDGTGEWCRSHENQKLRLLSREGKEGIGSALLAGLRYAEAKGYQWVVTMDADFSHAPSELPQLVAGRCP